MTSNEENNPNNNNINDNLNNNDVIILEENRNQQNSNLSQNTNKTNNQRNNKKIHVEDDKKPNTNDKIMTVKENDEGGMKIDNFAENNVNIRNIINNALFSQLSEINVKLLDFEENISDAFYKSGGKILPKIDFIEINLLNQSANISKFKKFGFGLYVFFLYLIELLVTFGVLFIFAFHYMYCIFYKYYREPEENFSFFFDYNILSLVSGVQLIKFRKYYINSFGKKFS